MPVMNHKGEIFDERRKEELTVEEERRIEDINLIHNDAPDNTNAPSDDFQPEVFPVENPQSENPPIENTQPENPQAGNPLTDNSPFDTPQFENPITDNSQNSDNI